MQVCACMRRWPRQEGGGADGYASSSSLSFLFCTTTCQVDRERSARVCAKRSNWRRKCRSIVCVWEVGVCWHGRQEHCFFSLSRSFCGKGEERWSSCGERLKVLCWSFLKGEVRHERWRQLLKLGLLDEGEENGTVEGPEVLSFFKRKLRHCLIDLGKASSRSRAAAQKTAVVVAYREPARQIGEQTCQIDRRQ
jgi:hypothetical protein